MFETKTCAKQEYRGRGVYDDKKEYAEKQVRFAAARRPLRAALRRAAFRLHAKRIAVEHPRRDAGTGVPQRRILLQPPARARRGGDHRLHRQIAGGRRPRRIGRLSREGNPRFRFQHGQARRAARRAAGNRRRSLPSYRAGRNRNSRQRAAHRPRRFLQYAMAGRADRRVCYCRRRRAHRLASHGRFALHTVRRADHPGQCKIYCVRLYAGSAEGDPHAYHPRDGARDRREGVQEYVYRKADHRRRREGNRGGRILFLAYRRPRYAAQQRDSHRR